MFKNIQIAFQDKSNKDLNRAYILFKAINNPFISKTLTIILKIAIWIRLPINNLITSTIYQHFCGGTTIENSETKIKKLWTSNIGTILDFSSERKVKESEFIQVMNETIKTIQKAKNKEEIPFAVFKPSGIVRFEILKKMNEGKQLTDIEETEKDDFIYRLENICKVASECEVACFIDAEESWIQDVIDDIALKMMRRFNKKRAIIFNTLQMYRKDRVQYLRKIIKDSKERKYILGLKIVRGAYHEKEIERSKLRNYKCPVYINKKQTDTEYNKALKICIENINQISICAGTHNEYSSGLLVKLMKENNIMKNDNRVYFSQLLGMSDHISYNAAKAGFNVAKYVPYGPIKDMIPYLIRRAEENTSISGQIGRELQQIILEKKRRKKG